jgi:isochorismate hydrolase
MTHPSFHQKARALIKKIVELRQAYKDEGIPVVYCAIKASAQKGVETIWKPWFEDVDEAMNYVKKIDTDPDHLTIVPCPFSRSEVARNLRRGSILDTWNGSEG